MKSKLSLVLSLLLCPALVTACSGTQDTPEATPPPSTLRLTEREVECVCGSTLAAVQGCYHRACLEGIGNSENPLCVCSPLFSEGAAREFVSLHGHQSANLGTVQYLLLKNGREVAGVLVADDGLTCELRNSAGTVTTYAYDDLAPRSVYRLMKGRSPRDDGEAQLELAAFTRDIGLYAHSRRHYGEAAKADPALADEVDAGLAELREIASGKMLAQGSLELQKGELRAAEKTLTALINEFPGEDAAAKAAELLGSAALVEEARSRSVQDMTAKIEKVLGPAHRDYERMAAKDREGLLSSSSQSKSIKSFESAVDSGVAALEKIARVREKNAEDEQVQQACDELEEVTIAQLSRSSMNLSSSYLTRESYQAALGAVNLALAYDPENGEVRSMRARVEAAASSDDDIDYWPGWHRRGRVGRLRR
jgi:tetratricopeptide (TPR) repeat protein